jgi:O-antigen/teichoic acid export membrane protein
MRPASDGAIVLALKGGAAALQFVLLVLTARWFGVEFRGEIALFNATVNLIVSYAFAVTVPVVIALGAAVLGVSLGHEAPLVVLVSVLYSLLVVHTCVLLAGREVWQATLLEFLRPFAIVGLAGALALTRGFRSPKEFYLVWGTAAVLAFAMSLPFMVAHLRRLEPGGPPPPLREVLRQLVSFGSMAQLSNVVQFMNYRLLYFALERHAGLAAVGLFSTAVSLAEVLWIPANSRAALALNRVSRESQAPGTRAFVLRLTRLALVAMLGAAVVAALVPVDGIMALLGRDFADVRSQLVRLLPGVVVLGVSLIASAYHAGHGLYARNLIAALAGLAVTLAGFAMLVPAAGATGALVTMNLSYLVTSTWLLVGFLRRERATFGELMPRIGDLRPARESGA